MRIPTCLKPGQAGISMTPLIDVVFQLLIFFLVANHLARRDMQLDLALPRAASGSPTPSSANSITINILSDGRIHVGGRQVSPDDLERRLANRVAQSGANTEVRIRSDRSVPYRQVEPVLWACSRSGITQVSIAVFRAEENR